MKIRCYSDTHLDHYFARGVPFNPTTGEMMVWKPPKLEDDKDTILVIAGDLWIGSRFIEWAGYSWIAEVSKQFKEVVITLGNHDYWPTNHGLEIVNAGDKLNAMLLDYGFHNVTVLDMTTKQIDDVLFVGATLWTDMAKEDPLAMHMMPRFMCYDGKITFVADEGGSGWARFTSEKWVEIHRKHKKYIELVASQNRDKKIVVVTHHAPLNTLIDPQFEGHFSNAYFASDLSDLILDNPNIALWVFGHVHLQRDTMMVNTRIVNNCVGYPGQHFEQLNMVKHEAIEV